MVCVASREVVLWGSLISVKERNRVLTQSCEEAVAR